MNKIVSLLIVLMLAGAPFAQAATAADCGMMPKHNFSSEAQFASQPSSCCQSCDCTIKADTPLFDKVSDFSKISVLPAGVISQAAFKSFIHSDSNWAIFFQKSPPKPDHLFSLYSVYRL